MPCLEAAFTLNAGKPSTPGTRHDRPVAFRSGTAELAGCLDHERPGSSAHATSHQLMTDEPGGPILAVAHEPFHMALTLDVAAERLVASSACQLPPSFEGLIGLLLHRADLK